MHSLHLLSSRQCAFLQHTNINEFYRIFTILGKNKMIGEEYFFSTSSCRTHKSPRRNNPSVSSSTFLFSLFRNGRLVYIFHFRIVELMFLFTKNIMVAHSRPSTLSEIRESLMFFEKRDDGHSNLGNGKSMVFCLPKNTWQRYAARNWESSFWFNRVHLGSIKFTNVQ